MGIYEGSMNGLKKVVEDMRACTNTVEAGMLEDIMQSLLKRFNCTLEDIGANKADVREMWRRCHQAHIEVYLKLVLRCKSAKHCVHFLNYLDREVVSRDISFEEVGVSIPVFKDLVITALEG